MLIKHQAVLLCIGKLGGDALAANTLGMQHLDDPILYTSSEKDILLIIQAADQFVKNNHKAVDFHANLFCRQVRALLNKPRFPAWCKMKKVFNLFKDTCDCDSKRQSNLSFHIDLIHQHHASYRLQRRNQSKK